MKMYPDISHWHPVTDWEAAKKNCPFLISKATQGTTYIDPTLSDFIEGCEKYGIPYWLYAYLKNGNETEQADYLIRQTVNKIGKCFVGYILDIEEGNTAANVAAALEYLAAHGTKTMIYTMYTQYSKYKDVIENRPENCAWWEARYGENTGEYSDEYPCHLGADLHQFTSRGSCPGIFGNCDLNRIIGREESWFTTTESNDPGVIYTVSVADVWTRAQAEALQKHLASRGIIGVVHKVQILE